MSKKNVVFELDRQGVKELMQSQEMQEVLGKYARQVQARAGEGYDVFVGKNRANVSVRTKEAEQDNFEHNTLLKSLKG